MLRTIRSKITAFTTVIVIITMSLISFLVYQVCTSLIINNSIQNLTIQTNLIANEVENGMRKVSHDVLVLSKTPPIQGIIRSVNNNGEDKQTRSNLKLWTERLGTIFKSMLRVNPNYMQISYIGLADQGRELVRVNRVGNSIFKSHTDVLQKHAAKNYFKEGISLPPGSIMFSNVDFDREHKKPLYPYKPTLRVIKPVYDEKESLFGLLVINLDISHYLRDILIRTENIGDLLIFNQVGDILIYYKDQGIMRYYDDKISPDTPITFLGKTYTKKTLLASLKQDKNLVVRENPIYINTYRDYSPYTVMTAVPKSGLLNREQFQLYNFFFWICLLALTSAILVYYFTKLITKNLSEMAESIKLSTSEGKKELRLPTHLNDEVGLLARAFNEKANELNHLAMFDALTQLPNRKNFIEHLDEAISRAKRSNQLFVVGFIDLNKFKEVNDTYGHQYGDELLIQFASELKSTLRESDFIGRLGGDEFAIIAENIHQRKDIANLFNRFNRQLNKEYLLKGVAIDLTISTGLSIYPEHGRSASDLITHADEAMYEAKRKKQAVVEIFSRALLKK